jgi:hypothetical protein
MPQNFMYIPLKYLLYRDVNLWILATSAAVKMFTSEVGIPKMHTPLLLMVG